MSLDTGVRVGPYEILARLGAGGMGEVYRARDERLGRDVALKILRDISSTDHLRRFEQEARAASALNHPGIVTIYDVGRADGLAYIAMEVVDGRSLRSIMAGQRLPPKETLRIATKMAEALAAAHERGIVHRDLKPENVVVSREGFVKILDFGLAKLVKPITETDETVPHTTPGLIFGTVGYMSPEQAAGLDVDYRSDQFSLGVMIYEMLTGRRPFQEATAAETMTAIIRDDAAPLAANDSKAEDVARIVMRLLLKEPARRYASTRDLALDLREARGRIASGGETRLVSDARAVSRRSTRLLVATVVTLAVAFTAVFLWLRHSAIATPPPGEVTVAVLPFVSATGAAGQPFADGLAEVISVGLVQSGMKVVAMYAGGAPDATSALGVAKRQGATTAIRGTVRHSNDELSVSFSIIETASGRLIGGDTITGRADVSQLEPQIVASIRASMKLSPFQSARATPAASLLPEDQKRYVEALGLLQRVSDEASVERAIDTLQKVLLNARDSALVNAQLARAFIYESQLSSRPELIEQASMYAERAVELDPADPEVRFRLGQVRLQGGRYAEAEAEFHRVLAARANDPDATLGLAVTNEKMGRASEAERMYRKAIALRPDRAPTYNVFASFLYNAGRYEEAAENFSKFNALIPTTWGYFNLASCYEALGQYDDARRADERSIALGENVHGYKGLGNVYYYTGAQDKAIKAFQSAVRLAPSDFEAWIGLSNALRWSGAPEAEWRVAYERSLETAQTAIRINPRDPSAQAIAAIALVELGRREEAAGATKIALKIDPTSRTALYAAAVVARERGDANAAIGWLEGAVRAGYSPANLRSDPEFESIRSHPAFSNALQQHR